MWLGDEEESDWLVVGWQRGGGGICLHRFALKLNTLVENMTINQCAPDCGLGRPGEGADEWFIVQVGKSAIFFGGRGGEIAFIFWPGCLNGTSARSQSRKTWQSNVKRWGLGWKRPEDGMAASVVWGDMVHFPGSEGFKAQQFWHHMAKCNQATWSQTTTTQQSNNVRKGWCASGQGGLYGHLFRPPLFICCIAKKKDWLGLVVVFLNHTLTISLEQYLK